MNIKQDIIENYKRMEESIVSQLALSNGLHGLSTGLSREDIWLQLFETIIPRKFVIEHSVFIIDSHSNVSNEVDLAIIDNTYTPYIFQYGRLKFVPIEAVAAVIECKSSDSGIYKGGEEKSVLEKWRVKMNQLSTSNRSIVRTAAGIVSDGILGGKSIISTQPDGKSISPTQTATRPIRIFCGYNTKGKEEDIHSLFDFVLMARDTEGQKKIDVLFDAKTTLQDWYISLNHHNTINDGNTKKNDGEILADKTLEDYKVVCGVREVSLLSFNFQLNQLLMLINNPILFPHLAYVDMFNGE